MYYEVSAKFTNVFYGEMCKCPLGIYAVENETITLSQNVPDCPEPVT